MGRMMTSFLRSAVSVTVHVLNVARGRYVKLMSSNSHHRPSFEQNVKLDPFVMALHSALIN